MWFWLLAPASILKPAIKPLLRILVGLIAIPLFRFTTRRIFKVQEIDEELEKDLEQWFKASLVLLVATRNMEEMIFGWIPNSEDNHFLLGLRLMMVIGVIESMPDQALFNIIHPGPPKLYFDRMKGLWGCCKEQYYAYFKGLACQHLSRSSPVFAFLSAIIPGYIGWICFGFAAVQYLIIGLVTSRDKALDVLQAFDEQMAIKRQEIIEEFGTQNADKTSTESHPAELMATPTSEPMVSIPTAELLIHHLQHHDPQHVMAAEAKKFGA